MKKHVLDIEKTDFPAKLKKFIRRWAKKNPTVKETLVGVYIEELGTDDKYMLKYVFPRRIEDI